MTKEETAAIKEYLKGIVSNLPEKPGCYQYLNADGKIIYVGKAKNLKRRVSSYFTNPKQTFKTQHLVPKIRDIRYVVVNTEEDALLLENNLIKRYKPHYNVLLKDDKTYPSIAISNEYLPRVFKVRKRAGKGATFFGPYSHVPTMYALLELCHKLYRPRPCRTPMTKEGVESGKYDLCLEYHIGNCAAPCVGKQTWDDYNKNIAACKEILRGNTAELERNIKARMLEEAEHLRFEAAEALKQQYLLLSNYRAKSEIVSSVIHNLDVFNIESEEKVAYINYLHVTNGNITQAFTFEYKKRLGESDEELLSLGIVEMRARYHSQSAEIVVPFALDLPESYATQTIPQKGDKKKLLELSKLNVKQYKFDRLKQADKLNPEQKSVRLMQEIQRELGLSQLPYRIELFDNSSRLRSLRKIAPGKESIQKVQYKNRQRARRLCLDARSRAQALHPPDRRRTATAEPHHSRRRKGANGSHTPSCGGRTQALHPHCRFSERCPPPHARTPLWFPAFKHRNESRQLSFSPPNEHARRSTSLRHHLPSPKAQQASDRLALRSNSRRRREDKIPTPAKIWQPETH